MSESETENRVRRCSNCNAVLVGPYCSQCGQREQRGDPRFADLAADLLEEFITWDSRVWRTLFPLLFRPGFLTAEFMSGRRARYVPPLRLYLILSFVMFLALSISNDITMSGRDRPAAPDRHPVEERQLSSIAGMESPEADAGSADRAGDGSSSGGGRITIRLADEDSPAWLRKLDRDLEEHATALKDDPGKFSDALLESMPQMMFFMLPLFALLLKFAYLFSPFHYLQHLVFSLHYHSFTFLLYLIGMLADRFGLHHQWLFFPCILVYLPVALWRAYDSGLVSATVKALVIYLVYAVLMGLAFAQTTLLVLLRM